MNALLLSQIVGMIRWGAEAIEAEANGEKSGDEIMAEYITMQDDFGYAVERWKNSSGPR